MHRLQNGLCHPYGDAHRHNRMPLDGHSNDDDILIEERDIKGPRLVSKVILSFGKGLILEKGSVKLALGWHHHTLAFYRNNASCNELISLFSHASQIFMLFI